MSLSSAFFYELAQFFSFSTEEITLISNAVNTTELEKGQVLLAEDSVCSSIYFVESGALCQYQINSNLDRDYLGLYLANNWVLNSTSYTSRKPSTTTIESIEKSSLLELTMDSIHELIRENPSFFRLGMVLELRDSFLNHSKPKEKYLGLLKERSELLMRFPLKMIASYLGMTPETLSRVRKEISRTS